MTDKEKIDPLKWAFPIIRDLHVHRLSKGRSARLISYDGKSGLYAAGDLRIELTAQWRYVIGEVDTITDSEVQEIVKAVRRNAPFIQPAELNHPRHGIIIFKNGVLDLHTMKLQEHSPKWKYTIGIPHNFDPDAKCPEFDKFISEVLPTESHHLIKQIIGYLLIPVTTMRKFFVFLGEGANGKSTLIEVIVAMLGSQNVSHQTLHALAQGRFSNAELFGKLANTCADLEGKDVKSSGLLKQIVAGDSMQYEKKFKDPFSGPATARLLFSANKMPRIDDTSKAVFDRLILMEFPQRFEESEQDKTLVGKLTAEAEVEGILARWALPGLMSLLESGRFVIPERSRQLLQQYQHQCDPFIEFVEARIEMAPAEFVTKADLYSNYRRWCDEQGIRNMALGEFNSRIRQIFNIPKHEDRRAPGTRDRVWPGIKLNDPVDPTTIPGKSHLKGAHLLGNPRNPKKEEL